MKQIGIIANPASGRDIRRLVAQGLVVDNVEKVNIVTRVILGAVATGVEIIHIMPDSFGLGEEALRKLRHTHGVKERISIIPMVIEGSQNDSTRAARYLEEHGVDVIVTLGGDGTNRAVSKGTLEVPLIPLSTGTNNVFPVFLEGTVAGILAAAYAKGRLGNAVLDRRKKMDVYRDGELVDRALIDAVVTDNLFVGSRAVWNMHDVTQVFLTQARPTDIGLSALGGCMTPVDEHEPRGLYMEPGPGVEATAPIAPGLVRTVMISHVAEMHSNERFPIETYPCVLALDGEREITFTRRQRGEVALNLYGPRVVNPQRAMRRATELGLFVSNKERIEWRHQ